MSSLLHDENIHLAPRHTPHKLLTRPLTVAVLNLMPMKEMTETDLLRLISNSSLPVDIELLFTSSHVSKNTPKSHLEAFYHTFDEVRDKHYDGLIVTGAPVEQIPFEEVDYWPELTQIFDWARTNVLSTLYICWGALAGLYYHYGIPKRLLAEKLSGVYPHRMCNSREPLFRGFDDHFYVPHSRFSYADRRDIEAVKELEIISDSDYSGVYVVKGLEGREFFITGHSEYSPKTLDFEYRRDMAKGLHPRIPKNYYLDDNPAMEPIVRWRAHANLLFTNWINYYCR